MELAQVEKKVLAHWVSEHLADPGDPLCLLLQYFENFAQKVSREAVIPGDTDFAKGKLAGIEFVVAEIRSLAASINKES